MGISSEKFPMKLVQHFIVPGEAFGGTDVNLLREAAKKYLEKQIVGGNMYKWDKILFTIICIILNHIIILIIKIENL